MKYFYLILIVLFSVKGNSQTNNLATLKIYSSVENFEKSFYSFADWEVYRWELLQRLQEVMGSLPYTMQKETVEYKVIDTLNTDKYLRLHVFIKESNNEEIPAYLYLPKRSSENGKLAAVIALQPTGILGKKIVGKQGKKNRRYAMELAERGYVVIAPDYVTFGGLKDFDLKNSRYVSGTIAGIYYHMRCVDLLIERYEVDPNRIGVIGHSLGGHNAMFLAAFDTRLKVCVTSCGWTQFDYYDTGPVAIEKYGGRLGPWTLDRYMPRIRDQYNMDPDKLPFNFHEIIALIAPRALFSNSPINDKNFAYKGVIKGISMAKGIYSSYHAKPNLQVRYPNAGHDFPTEIRRESYEFIDKILGHSPNKHVLE